jgi:hypothetical protein
MSSDNPTHEYRQTPRPPFSPQVCAQCGLTSTIDGNRPVDAYIVYNPGEPIRERLPLCLGCLARVREYGFKVRRVRVL